MTNVIPQEVLNIYKKLETEGFEVYFVGGSVRDLMLKREIKDWDLTTNAAPFEIQKIFPKGFYNNEFGTVGVAWEKASGPGGPPARRGIVEITTYRTEISLSPTHKPEKIAWGKSIEEDLARRDFTINAIALKLVGKSNTFEIIDPYNGQVDLGKKIIKAVGNADLRFKEDALRLLRAIRITTELEFKIEESTWEKIVEDASLIEHISKERIQTELLRILKSKNAYNGIVLFYKSGLLGHIIPELLEGVGVSQQRPGRHHTTDVFTHNIMSLKFCPSDDPVVKFAALIHDIGKPKAMSKDENGLVIFYNHEVTGAKIAEKVCERLKFSKKDKEKVVNLVRWHMFSVNENLTDAGIRKFIRRIGVENVKDMMDLRVGDRLGGGTQTAESWRLKLFKKKVEEQLKPAPFSINDLKIDGNDIMKVLQIKPGPKVGEILQKLFEEVDEDLSKNNKEYLLGRIKNLI
ncbi:MAG: hypothetical protein COU25_00760 [Candidatus Levybacteria bacterium CG10_big_fil_rev_8_21_14_0_10_35_13]|nr:MAG: hypothetical protein COU25_00760 [Candidatus Levybacteria bacterium CG10_big_fil_rev_8_21_14_0_10_35_13]